MIVISGLPGKLASMIARYASDRVAPIGLCSERHAGSTHQIVSAHDSARARGVRLESSLEAAQSALVQVEGVAVGLELSPAAIEHLPLWQALQIPVVVGSTAFDRVTFEQEIVARGLLAVIAPNFCGPIVALQQILRDAAQRYPGAFQGFSLHIEESHQAAKRDKSGTARALLPSLAALGFSPATEASIESIRDPAAQRVLGVPEEYLGGHGWHRYEARSGQVALALEHRTNGREMYVTGALQACEFAVAMWQRGERGKVYEMLDVVRSMSAATTHS